jgi:sigma-B regulation protein RsbU (phosphoserine phosphatase)
MSISEMLHARKRQIDSLLKLTRAINSNSKEVELFDLFRTLMEEQMGVSKLTLFYKREIWINTFHFGDCPILNSDIVLQELQYHKQIVDLSENAIIGLEEYSFLIPILHKEQALAFLLIDPIIPSMYGTRDEKLHFTETLANIIITAIENKRLFKQQLQQAGLREQLHLAGQLQSQLVPKNLPYADNLQIDSIYLPHDEVGGDYFDYFLSHHNHHVFCVADVSGKGISAALLMSNLQASLRALMLQDLSLKEIIHELNKRILSITKQEKFITLFLAVYNENTKSLHYVNAGHVAPYVFTADTNIRLHSNTNMLGILDRLKPFEVQEISLEKDSLLLLFTDGLSELQNEKEQYFEDVALDQFGHLFHTMQPKHFNSKLVEQIQQYRGQMPIGDDITVMTIRVNP